MYAGHLGIALALRARRDAPPLWLLAVAAQGPDWVEGVLEVTGYRWLNPATSPHAVPRVVAGALCAGVVAALLAVRGRRPPVAAWLLASVAYLSHWAADYITGIKPTWEGGPMVGLGLYGRPGLDFVLEALVVTAGWWVWRRSLPAESRTSPRRVLAWALLGALLALQLGADLVMGAWLS